MRVFQPFRNNRALKRNNKFVCPYVMLDKSSMGAFDLDLPQVDLMNFRVEYVPTGRFGSHEEVEGATTSPRGPAGTE